MYFLNLRFDRLNKLSNLLIVIKISLVMNILFFTTVYAYNLEYHATIDQDSKHVNVKVIVSELNDNIDSLIVNLPNINDNFDLNNYAQNKIAYSNSKSINIKDIEDEHGKYWKIENISSENTLTIEYDLDKIIYRGDNIWLVENPKAVVYFDSEYGYFASCCFFLVPENYKENVDQIHINLDVPQEWKIMSPFLKDDGTYKVEEDNVISIVKHLKESFFYMGEVKYEYKISTNGTEHLIAKMEGDDNRYELTDVDEIRKYLDKTSKVYNYIANIFKDNPFHKCLWSPNFHENRNDTQINAGWSFTGCGWSYWPNGREFEITSHLIQSWMGGNSRGPLMAETGIYKGIGEFYLGSILDYEIFNDSYGLAQLYYSYQVYERILNSPLENHYESEFFQGLATAILLDNKLKEVSNNKYNIKDILSLLYQKYSLTDHQVTYENLENEINNLEGVNFSNLFSNYVYGTNKVPSYQYIADYKEYFKNMPYMLENNYYMRLYGRILPAFICLEFALQRDDHIMAGMWNNGYLEEFADHIINNYAIESLTAANVEDALSELTGEDCSGFFTHWEDTYGRLQLEDLKEWLTFYKNDTDKDGLSDSWENRYFGNIHTVNNVSEDYDNDGLINSGEYQFGTNPKKRDTDGDGFTDGEEVQTATDPTKKTDYPQMSIDIDVNYSDNPITIVRNESPILTINLTPGNKKDQNSDWWIAAYSPLGWKSLIIEQNRLVWTEGIKRCLEAELTHLESIEIPAPPLEVGENHIYFAVDDNADGNPDVTWWDSVEVNVE